MVFSFFRKLIANKIFKIKIVCFSMGKPKSKSKAQKSKCSGKEKGQFQNLKFLK